MIRMRWQTFVCSICTPTIIVLLASCGVQGTHPSELPNSPSPSVVPSESRVPTQVDLVISENPPAEAWSIALYNDSKAISLPLYSQDFISLLGPNYITTTSDIDGRTIYVYTDSGISFTKDNYGNINYISANSASIGWKLNGKVGPGDTYEALKESFGTGTESSSSLTFFFSNSGEELTQSKDIVNADAMATFDITNGVISGLRVSAINQLPPPFLSTDGVCTIYHCYSNPPNSAGGVDVEINFTNDSKSEIKYITFMVTPYNAVNDPVASEIGGMVQAALTGTGPYPQSQKGDLYTLLWENVWYNSTVDFALINSVNIEYMDGSKVTLIAPDP